MLGGWTLAPHIGTKRHEQGASAEQLWSRSYRTRLAFSDTVIVVMSVAIAFLARFGLGNDDLGGLGQLYWAVAFVFVTTWLLLLGVFHTRESRIIGIGVTEYQRVAGASFFTFGLLAILFVIGKVDIARGFFVLALPVGLTGLTASRWLWRRWLTRQRAGGHYLSRALVGGAPADVVYVVDQINRNSNAVYNIVGVAIESDGVGGGAPAGLAVPVVADLSTIAMAAGNLHVDTVIVAGRPSEDPTFIRDLSWQLEGAVTELVLASRLTDVAGPRIHFRPMEGLPLIHVEIPQFEGGKHLLKRALDVVFSGIALILLAPLFVLLGVIVRLDSEGGAIFRQVRVGRNSRMFRMLKFRSMVASAEADQVSLEVANEGAGLLFKLKADPRVTRVGRVLRKYSLDELPQLWNVFIGDMSLVGPRPPLPNEVEEYESHVRRRLFIKPGLTGMWQVNGRSDLSWDESVRLDLYYVENWSLTGDLIIMWRTLRVLLRPVGAY
ncbi:MAG: sugar transferase [Microbacteriaceae bacterium]|nr:MAG: sugar transferase [Microbacteriaceae bacterium]